MGLNSALYSGDEFDQFESKLRAQRAAQAKLPSLGTAGITVQPTVNNPRGIVREDPPEVSAKRSRAMRMLGGLREALGGGNAQEQVLHDADPVARQQIMDQLTGAPEHARARRNLDGLTGQMAMMDALFGDTPGYQQRRDEIKYKIQASADPLTGDRGHYDPYDAVKVGIDLLDPGWHPSEAQRFNRRLDSMFPDGLTSPEDRKASGIQNSIGTHLNEAESGEPSWIDRALGDVTSLGADELTGHPYARMSKVARGYISATGEVMGAGANELSDMYAKWMDRNAAAVPFGTLSASNMSPEDAAAATKSFGQNEYARQNVAKQNAAVAGMSTEPLNWLAGIPSMASLPDQSVGDIGQGMVLSPLERAGQFLQMLNPAGEGAGGIAPGKPFPEQLEAARGAGAGITDVVGLADMLSRVPGQVSGLVRRVTGAPDPAVLAANKSAIDSLIQQAPLIQDHFNWLADQERSQSTPGVDETQPTVGPPTPAPTVAGTPKAVTPPNTFEDTSPLTPEEEATPGIDTIPTTAGVLHPAQLADQYLSISQPSTAITADLRRKFLRGVEKEHGYETRRDVENWLVENGYGGRNATGTFAAKRLTAEATPSSIMGEQRTGAEAVEPDLENGVSAPGPEATPLGKVGPTYETKGGAYALTNNPQVLGGLIDQIHQEIRSLPEGFRATHSVPKGMLWSLDDAIDKLKDGAGDDPAMLQATYNIARWTKADLLGLDAAEAPPSNAQVKGTRGGNLGRRAGQADWKTVATLGGALGIAGISAPMLYQKYQQNPEGFLKIAVGLATLSVGAMVHGGGMEPTGAYTKWLTDFKNHLGDIDPTMQQAITDHFFKSQEAGISQPQFPGDNSVATPSPGLVERAPFAVSRLKQERFGSKGEVLNALKGQVGPEEMEHGRIAQAIDMLPDGPVTKQQVLDALSNTLNPIHTYVRNNSGITTLPEQTPMDRMGSPNFDQIGGKMYVTDPAEGGHYQEVVRSQGNDWDVRSQHFNEPGYITHTRRNTLNLESGQTSHHVEEVQSDLHQGARQARVVDETLQKEFGISVNEYHGITREMDEAARQIEDAVSWDERTKLLGTPPELWKVEHPDILQSAANAGVSEESLSALERGADLSKEIETAHPGWTENALLNDPQYNGYAQSQAEGAPWQNQASWQRPLLLEAKAAAASGKDVLSWINGDTTDYRGAPPGAGHFYDTMIPQFLKQSLAKAGVPEDQIVFGTDKAADGSTVNTLQMTPPVQSALSGMSVQKFDAPRLIDPSTQPGQRSRLQMGALRTPGGFGNLRDLAQTFSDWFKSKPPVPSGFTPPTGTPPEVATGLAERAASLFTSAGRHQAIRGPLRAFEKAYRDNPEVVGHYFDYAASQESLAARTSQSLFDNIERFNIKPDSTESYALGRGLEGALSDAQLQTIGGQNLVDAKNYMRDMMANIRDAADSALTAFHEPGVGMLDDYFPHMDPLARTWVQGMADKLAGTGEDYGFNRRIESDDVLRSGHTQYRSGNSAGTYEMDGITAVKEYVRSMNFATAMIEPIKRLDALKNALDARAVRDIITSKGQATDKQITDFVRTLDQQVANIRGEAQPFDKAAPYLSRILNFMSSVNGDAKIAGSARSVLAHSSLIPNVVAAMGPARFTEYMARIMADKGTYAGISAMLTHDAPPAGDIAEKIPYMMSTYHMPGEAVRPTGAAIRDASYAPLQVLEYVTARIASQAALDYNTARGVPVAEATANADRFVRRLIPDRTRTGRPNIYAAKMLRPLVQFTEYPNNQLRWLAEDVDKGMAGERLAKGQVASKLAAMSGMALLIGAGSRALVGDEHGIDPLRALYQIALKNPGHDLPSKIAYAAGRTVGEIAPSIPYTSTVLAGLKDQALKVPGFADTPLKYAGSLPITGSVNRLGTDVADAYQSHTMKRDGAKILARDTFGAVAPGGTALLRAADTAQMALGKATGGGSSVRPLGHKNYEYAAPSKGIDWVRSLLFGPQSTSNAERHFKQGGK